MTAITVPGRSSALDVLGKEIPEGMSASEAMRHAGLSGWNVHKRPIETATLWTPDGGAPELTDPLAVEGFFATVRTNPATRSYEPLGVVGRTYVPIQNEAHVELLDTIVDEGGARFATAAEMRGGRDVFMSILLPDTITIGGVDPIERYLVAFNSHDGSSAFKIAATNIRVFCANQQSAVMKGAASSWVVRHTSGARGILQAARTALDIAYKYDSLFELEAEKMIQETMDEARFNELVRGLFDEPAETAPKATKSIDEKRMNTLSELFHDAPTNRNIRGTVWAGYQAITEYVDHYAPAVKGRYARTDEEARAYRTLTGDNASTLKNNAFRISRELVSA
jgi:phage/plasmid-like protein (TIGR03299 family)